MIGIIDLGISNVNSVKNMFKKVGISSIVSSDISKLSECRGYVLPGVGAYDSGVRALHSIGIFEFIKDYIVKENKPLLGICLGMQLLCTESEEGKEKGLDIFPATVKSFKRLELQSPIKVPHMRWNQVQHATSHLFDDLDNNKFYFTHSFYVDCPKEYQVGVTSHGIDFVSAFNKENIWGVQFHPEKSHIFGMKFMKNFGESL